MRSRESTSPKTIGRLAEVTGVNIETIRYYERIGMLAEPPRSPAGHRRYGPEHVASLAFIRRGRELGFSLEEIRDLVRLSDGGACCEKARAVTVAHRTDIRRKIADLKRLDRALSGLIAECGPARSPECPILEALTGKPSAGRIRP